MRTAQRTKRSAETMTPTATAEANKELVRGFVNELLVKGEWGRLDEYIAEDYVGHSAAAPEDIRGPDGFREFYSGMRAAFPDLDVTIQDLIAEDDKVVQRSLQSGTHDGEFMGLEPTGNTFEVPGIVIYRIEDGRITEDWVQADMLGMMEQLGLE